MQEKAPGLLFDVDGTLVDSNYLHTLAWARACDDVDEMVPMSRIHRLIGMGAGLLAENLVGEEKAEQVKDGHRRHFRRLRGELRAFQDARELLEDVAARKLKVVLATSANKEDVDALLATIGQTDAVSAITHSADVDRAKPDPDIFCTAMESAGVDPQLAMAVGDTVWDVEAAKRAGIACICVLTGGVSRGELEEAGAIAVYSDVAELRRCLDDSPLARLTMSRRGDGRVDAP